MRQNTLTDFDIGVNLNNSKIALNQGTFTDPSHQTAWDNQWFMTGTKSNTYKVGESPLDGLQINWYHQDPDDPTYSYSPNPYPPDLVLADPDETTASFTCSSTVVNSVDRVVEFGSIVGDSAEYAENSEENTYLARALAYQAMKLDSTIIYQSDSLDADFEAFFERHDTTNIGKFYMVESLIERETDSAMVILEFISPENNIETYLIEHYQREREITERNYELSTADSAFYIERSAGIPATDGEVYYHSLGNLFMEQHIPIVASRFGQQPLINGSPFILRLKPELKVYPIPTKGLLTIQFSDPQVNLSEVEIYNSLGELVYAKRIENNNYIIDMTSHKQGIYIIRCFDQLTNYYTKSFNLLK